MAVAGDAEIEGGGRPARRRARKAGPARRHHRVPLPQLRPLLGGALLSNTGTWVPERHRPPVVFKLTGSAGWLGVAAFAQLFPAWLMGPTGGVIADRFHAARCCSSPRRDGRPGLLGRWCGPPVCAAPVIVGIVALSGIVAGLNIASWQAFVAARPRGTCSTPSPELGPVQRLAGVRPPPSVASCWPASASGPSSSAPSRSSR